MRLYYKQYKQTYSYQETLQHIKSKLKEHFQIDITCNFSTTNQIIVHGNKYNPFRTCQFEIEVIKILSSKHICAVHINNMPLVITNADQKYYMYIPNYKDRHDYNTNTYNSKILEYNNITSLCCGIQAYCILAWQELPRVIDDRNGRKH